jgi:hydrogenase nickel incorporation protein HypA/HybF
MHEMSIAESLLTIILQESQSHQASRVVAVALRIGELSSVVPESLRFCFEMISQGTIVEGAELRVERVPVACRCEGCGTEFTVEHLLFMCPACQSRRVAIQSGRELTIESLEVE